MTPRKPTQMDRVLLASRSYRGVCQADLLGPDVVDGGKPITRLAARIEDLETKRNCLFEDIGWRSGTKIYRLVEGPDVERAGGGAAVSQTHAAALEAATRSLSVEPRLFELAPLSAYDPMSEAA